MTIEETSTLNIVCDNPDCQGHPDLDSSERTGWMFVTHEIYGEPTSQHIFGNAECLSVGSGSHADTLGMNPGASVPPTPPNRGSDG
jgi:hypothetical protein